MFTSVAAAAATVAAESFWGYKVVGPSHATTLSPGKIWPVQGIQSATGICFYCHQPREINTHSCRNCGGGGFA